MAATSGTVAQGAVLLIAYTLGLGLPFIAHRRRLRPRAAASWRRSSATAASVSLIGGLLVAAIGVAMVFDWLALLPAVLQLQHGDLR